MKLSKIQKLRISVDIANHLKENNHPLFYINQHDESIEQKIAIKAGIKSSSYGLEAGQIEISEYISLTQDEREDNLLRKLNGDRRRHYNHGVERFPWEGASEETKLLAKEFEEKNVKESGPSDTLIGEIFRAIRYIQYRAHNDGDVPYLIDSQTFLSYMFVISKLDELNYSRHSYNEETGQYSFKFNDPFLEENSWEGKITNVIEHSLAMDADFIKYQLIDLLSNGKIKDEKNEYDSRSFRTLKQGRDY